MSKPRKKKGRPISGWIVLDKPLNMGSTQAVGKLKWLFGAQKAGHAGTLDPLATGILPIALGEATKTVAYIMDGSKAYRFSVSWGTQTSSDDLEGEVVKSSDLRPSRADIESILPDYIGSIKQVPPQFSAIKIDGERAYDLARHGENVEIKPRMVEIESLKIVDHYGETTVFEVECGKGTYVRSLARDMGTQLGCCGHISELRRTFVDPFEESDCVSLQSLEQARGDDEEPNFPALDSLLIESGEAMAGLPRIDLTEEQAKRIRMGNPAFLLGRDAPIQEDEACAFVRGRLVAIGEIARGEFRPKRVLNS